MYLKLIKIKVNKSRVRRTDTETGKNVCFYTYTLKVGVLVSSRKKLNLNYADVWLGPT